MPATPERMMLVYTEYRTVTAGPDSGVVARYGDAARDTGPDPVETFFHSTTDAQIFANERLALTSRDAVRMEISAQGLQTGIDIALSTESTVATVQDSERDINRPMLVAGVKIGGGNDTTQLTVWG